MKKPPVSGKARAVAGALHVYLKPKLAKDAKIDLRAIVAPITPKNFADMKPKLASALTLALDGKLAKDAKLDDLALALDAMEDMDTEAMDMETEPNAGVPPTKAEDEDDETEEERKDRLAKRAKDKRARDKAARDAENETEEEKKAREAKEAADSEEDKEKDKKAMDAALARVSRETEARVVKRMQETAEAREFVRPLVGVLPMALDTADGVLRSAAKVLGVPDADDASLSVKALRALVTAYAPKNERPHRIALDSAKNAEAEFRAMFPNAAPIRRVG